MFYRKLSVTEVINNDRPEETNNADVDNAPGERNDEEIGDLKKVYYTLHKMPLSKRMTELQVRSTGRRSHNKSFSIKNGQNENSGSSFSAIE